MSVPPLREYQLRAVEGLRENIRAGVKNQILCAPTGSGKLVMGAHLIEEAQKKGKRALFVVDRLSLLDQTSAAFDLFGLDHGIVQGGNWRFRPYLPVQVCSQQTLARREWPEADLLIVDEAHVLTETVTKRIAKRDIVTIGLTATPTTRSLGKHYDALVNVTTTNELIAQGFLSPYRIFAASEPNMEGVKVVAGEWDEKQTSERAMEVVGDCVVEYLKHGEGKKFIAFSVDVAHAEELARQFTASGVVAMTSTYKDRDEDRAETLAEFRKPDSYIRGLISVESLTRGFDVPQIEVLILARPLRKAFAVHIQMMGRVLRIAEGKTEATVLDHAGNCQRFWQQMNEFYEHGIDKLDDGKKREKPKNVEKDEADELMKCPQCKHLHKRRPFCPACGFAYPKREAVKHVAGTLKELIASGNRKALTADLWGQVAGYARERRGDNDAGRKMALALFKSITGVWPLRDFESTPSAPMTPECANRIRAANIRWARSRGRQEQRAA